MVCDGREVKLLMEQEDTRQIGRYQESYVEDPERKRRKRRPEIKNIPPKQGETQKIGRTNCVAMIARWMQKNKKQEVRYGPHAQVKNMEDQGV